MARAVTIAALKDFCRTLPGTTEDVKWGADLIFSVGGKMYAGFDADEGGDEPEQFAFKCDDVDFERLTRVKGIVPAPYAARFGWVKVCDLKALSGEEARLLLRKAHGLILAKLPERTRRTIQSGQGNRVPRKVRRKPAG